MTINNYIRKNITEEVAIGILDPNTDIDDTGKYFQEILLGLCFSDFYVKIRYHEKTQTLTDEDLLMIPTMEGITKFSDIEIACDEVSGFYENLLLAPTDFYNATALEKLARIKSLDMEDKEFLCEISETFQLDKDQYDKYIELDTYMKYYRNLLKSFNYGEEKILKENIEIQIASFIKNLYFWDQSNAIDNILNLAFIDYQFSLFIKNNNQEYPNIGYGIRKVIKRMNLYEEAQDDEVIQMALLDDYYLMELINTYYYVTLNNLLDKLFLNLPKSNQRVYEKSKKLQLKNNKRKGEKK